jgi:hypothetical protein
MHQKVKFFILAFIFNLVAILGYSTVYTTVSDGNWSNNNTWDANGSPGTYWGTGDQVFINHDVNPNQNIGYAGDLTVNASGSLINSGRDIALYNGATINFSGDLSLNNLTLNSTSTGIHSGSLTLNNNLVVGNGSNFTSNGLVSLNSFTNNGGTVTFNNTFDANGSVTNNNGTITFNDNTNINGGFENNNINAEVNINDDFYVEGDFRNNSSSTLNVNSSGTLDVDGNFIANSGTEINIEGRINTRGNFSNNGGDIQNNGIMDTRGNFTQNGGTFTNDGVMLVEGNFRVNGGGTVDGNGIIRTDDITNYGTISGDNDICTLDEDGNPSQQGGGAYSAGTSYCEESASAALPIKLDFFKGKANQNSYHFYWRTLSEINNDYFTIEGSVDSKHYYEIEKNEGAGNSNMPLEYERTVINSNKGYKYFRLKQTDFDGKYTFSKPILIQLEKKNHLNLYPVPNTGDQLMVELKNLPNERYQIDLLSSNGTLLFSESVYIEESTSYYETNILKGQTLSKGVYFLRVSSLTNRFLEKLIVK